MSGVVLVVGSLNVDVVATVARLPSPGETVLAQDLRRQAGGKGANQAVAAAAAGATVAMVGCVGADDAGSAYRDRLTRLGVDCAHLRSVAGAPTGQAHVWVDADGQNSIVVWPGANAWLDAQHVSDALGAAGPGDVVVVQLEIGAAIAARAVRVARARGARVVLNLSPYVALPADVVGQGDPVIVNEVEALNLADSGLVAASLLVTFGANGAAWGELRQEAPEVAPADVVDTTGAGDAFCGALAAALAAGGRREPALDAALRAGSAAVRHRGAQPDGQLVWDARR